MNKDTYAQEVKDKIFAKDDNIQNIVKSLFANGYVMSEYVKSLLFIHRDSLWVNLFAQTMLIILDANNWEEPTTKKYLTYVQAYEKYGTNAKAPYFEDMHGTWRTYKPSNYEEPE